MEVLLINPFLEVLPDDPAGINPALSLGYLAAYLEEKGVQVAVLDIAAEGIDNVRKVDGKIRSGLEEEEIIERVRRCCPKIVGITCISTLHAREAHRTAQLVKKANPKILVLMGGAHPSAVPKEVLADRNVDIVVQGEGEITLWEITKSIKQGESLENIVGTFGNPPRPRIKDLDELPFPARHLLPMKTYFRQTVEGTSYAMREPSTTMITSRGCPGNCVYCAVRTVWGRTWIGRSPKNVVDEIDVLIKTFGVREIHFLDDSMAVDRKRLEVICDEMIRRKLDIKWTTPNGIAIWMLNKDLILKMKNAGCYRLTFGLESGNKDILHNYIGKHYDYDQARGAIRFASRIGLWTVGTFIIGFPYEEREQIEDTIDFAISTDLDFAVFYIANPFPGTPMHEDYRKAGLLPKGGSYRIVRGCQSKYFSHQELLQLQAEAFNRFLKSRFRRPWRFLTKIKSVEDLVYTFKLGKNLFGTLRQDLVRSKGIASLWK